jgi:hypothetical protein
MIARHCFSKEWIAEQRKKFPRTDPYLIERQLAAFELLGLLVQTGKEFIFKGGTALLLLLPVARRLSIDIDIVGNFSPEEHASLVKDSHFTRMEVDEREKKAIPKRHFKFYYKSVVDGREAYVLLDVLYTDHGFPKVVSMPITNALFETDKKVSVTTPTVNGITGDKLTAFAPHTIGVPYGADKSMEIIKQLFDIGELFDHCSDLSEVSAAYAAIGKQEASFRDKEFTVNETLDDTIETAFLVSQARLKGSVDNDELKEIQKGIGKLTNYFLGIRYTLEEARLSASKIALLATLLRNDKTTASIDELRFNQRSVNEIRNVTLQGKFQILNKLKGLNPEAFYYWWIVSKSSLRPINR